MRVVPLGSNGHGGFAVVGGRRGVGSVGQKQLDDFEMPICGGGQQRCVAWPVAVVRVEATFEEELHNFGVARGNRRR